MSTQKHCDHCGFARQRVDGTAAVVRYTLRREVDQTRVMGQRVRRYQQSAGGIDLCDECWQKICGPRVNRNKAHSRPRVVA